MKLWVLLPTSLHLYVILKRAHDLRYIEWQLVYTPKTIMIELGNKKVIFTKSNEFAN